ncbi:MAG: hypothetical protein LBN97_05390 [Oscillospiraceae bacterium]|jgi:hypothetical protein|nr:hypothetical protein [Oscillospiraceae bacterium]
MLEEYTKVELKTGQIATIVDVLRRGEHFAYIAEVADGEGDYDTEMIHNTDIESVFVEVKTPLADVLRAS